MMAMIASVAKLKSKLTEKGATRPSAIMRKKMPNGSSELQEMPRRREYAEGAEGEGCGVEGDRTAGSCVGVWGVRVVIIVGGWGVRVVIVGVWDKRKGRKEV